MTTPTPPPEPEIDAEALPEFPDLSDCEDEEHLRAQLKLYEEQVRERVRTLARQLAEARGMFRNQAQVAVEAHEALATVTKERDETGEALNHAIDCRKEAEHETAEARAEIGRLREPVEYVADALISSGAQGGSVHYAVLKGWGMDLRAALRPAKIDGKWCKQHSPEYVAKKNAEREARFEAEMAAMRARADERQHATACARALPGVEDPEGAVDRLVAAREALYSHEVDTDIPGVTEYVVTKGSYEEMLAALAPFLAARARNDETEESNR